MKKKYFLLLFLLVVGSKSFSQTNDATVSGIVRDENGKNIPGVSIGIEGTSYVTTTKEDGSYSLTIPAGNQIKLVFYLFGNKKEEVVFDFQPG